MSYVCPHCNCFPCVTTCGGYRRDTDTASTERRNIAIGGVRLVEANTNAPDRVLVVQLGANATEAKVFKAHEAPLRLLDNLINALKLLANQQKYGDSPTQSVVPGLHERSRSGIMDGLRRCIQTDNHSGWTWVICVKAQDRFMSKNRISVRLTQRRPSGKGADELTLRAGEVGTQRAFINTDHIELERRGPPLVDADWHAFRQAIYKGIEGKELEQLYCHHRDMSRATGATKPCENQKAKAG